MSCCFKSEKPLIHKVYHKQVSLVKKFFSYFMEPDALSKCKSGAVLLKLGIEKNLLPVDLMFIGSKVDKFVKKLRKDHTDAKDFMNRVKETYVECGKYIQPKLHLENETLKALCAIDPLLVCSPHKLVLKCLLSLPTLVPTVLEDEEENKFQKEVHALCVDGNLPSPLNDEDKVDCLEWWDKISDRYNVTFKVVCAILSIFHGSRVESTFSVMKNVVDQNSGRMNMETYGAIQDIKYSLKTHKPCQENQSVKVFRHSDRFYSRIDPKISNDMRHSYLKLCQKRSEEKEKSKE